MQKPTLHLVAPMAVLTNLQIGTEHRKSDWEYRHLRKHMEYCDKSYFTGTLMCVYYYCKLHLQSEPSSAWYL